MSETVERQINTTDLLTAIHRSGLLQAKTLQSALQHLDLKQCSAEDVVDTLVDSERITHWQARQLLKGRWRGFRLGKYRLLKELGRGGMARVFLARHETLQSLVAIKVLSRSRLQKSSVVERFLREARSAATLSHPNIVRVFDIDFHDDRHYLVMEYVNGWNLQELVDNEGVLPFRKAAALTLQAAEGLAHAHAAGLVHRDIKPANLLVEGETSVKVSDFGLALVDNEDDDASLTMQHDEKVLGTADYMAPEQAINSHRINAQADQYSLGCTLYFMLTGRAPFPSGRIVERITKHCTAEPDSVESFRPDVPTEIRKILHRLTRKNPVERFPSMKLAAAALQQWLAGERIGTTNSKQPTPSQANLTTAPSSIADDDLLTLAPEDEDPCVVANKHTAAAETDPPDAALAPSSNLGNADPLDVLPEDSLLWDATQDGEELAFSELIDEWPDDASISATPATTGSKSDVSSQQFSPQGSGLFSAASAANMRDTKAPGQTLATNALATRPQTESTPTRFFAEMYEGFKRDEYPLWILIGAGVILGAILLFVAYSYLTSFELPNVPVRSNET